jgi:hypothetical protein
LTELGLALAERTFEEAEEAETPEARAEQVKTFHIISRSVRQSVALEARLARQQAHDLADVQRVAAATPPRKTGAMELTRRINAVRGAVTRVIWHEAEDDDSGDWLETALYEELASASRRDDFCAEALDDHIVRLCVEMGLTEEAALRWRDLPDPNDPPNLDADDADARSPPPPDAGGPEPQPQSSA